MIVGKIHRGAGLGNQLHSILMTRVLALDKGLDYGFVGTENFKGNSFLKLDWGVDPKLEYHMEYPAGKLIVDSEHRLFEEGTNYFNPETQFIEDGTVIDGLYQDERYFEHYIFVLANHWLKVEKIHVPDDVCVIGFRGGEFYLYPELGLPKSYFEEGIAKMRELNPKMKFEVHTDDEALAKQFFPELKVIHDIGINWRSMRYAKYAIIANSSFYILPRLCRHAYNVDGEVTIAPRYWARRNTGEWSMPQNYYKAFNYI